MIWGIVRVEGRGKVGENGFEYDIDGGKCKFVGRRVCGGMGNGGRLVGVGGWIEEMKDGMMCRVIDLCKRSNINNFDDLRRVGLEGKSGNSRRRVDKGGVSIWMGGRVGEIGRRGIDKM